VSYWCLYLYLIKNLSFIVWFYFIGIGFAIPNADANLFNQKDHFGEYKMNTLTPNSLISNLPTQEPQHHIRVLWVAGLLFLFMTVLALKVGNQMDWGGHKEWLRTAVFSAFTVINSLRILAYVPQMLVAAKDTHGASGISYATWTLFLVSHLTTISYAIVCVGDSVMALIFLGNALACLAVVAITFFKRRQHAAKRMSEL
jgi:hypothetical protein